MSFDDDIEDFDDIEIEEFDAETTSLPSSFRPGTARTPGAPRPGRLYVTGIITGILLVALAFLLFDILKWHPFSTTPAADKVYELSKTLESFIDRYYWKSDTSDEQFANMSAKGMVAALGDPYSVFLTPEELDQTRERNNGDYTGIGVSVGVDTATGRKYITRIELNSPAEKAGLQVGDEIRAVDDISVQGESLDDMVARIRSREAGVSHTFTVFRSASSASGSAVSGGTASGSGDGLDAGVLLTLTVTTDTIVNQSINYQMLRDHIGYLKISTYDRETPKQFHEALSDLNKQGMKALIIDERNNGGGVLTAVLDILDQLLPAGTLLTETHKNAKDTIYKSTDKDHFDKPMAVLINGHSASASEVFAGVLQDRNQVPLVGETSYGKGIVQSIYTLPDDKGGIKLTTGEYLLPSGRSIHGTGLTPDAPVTFTGTDDDYGTNNDNQLIRALELMQEKIR